MFLILSPSLEVKIVTVICHLSSGMKIKIWIFAFLLPSIWAVLKSFDRWDPSILPQDHKSQGMFTRLFLKFLDSLSISSWKKKWSVIPLNSLLVRAINIHQHRCILVHNIDYNVICGNKHFSRTKKNKVRSFNIQVYFVSYLV